MTQWKSWLGELATKYCSELLTLSFWITVGLGLLSTRHDHPCWRAKRSQRPHKVVQAVERNTKPPIHITKEVKNENQELHKRMGIFYLHVMKHGCLEPWNKFHGRNQLQLGTGPCFHVCFTGLNGFVMLHGMAKKQPAPWLTPSQLSSWPAWAGLLLIQSFLLMAPTWRTWLSSPSNSCWSGTESSHWELYPGPFNIPRQVTNALQVLWGWEEIFVEAWYLIAINGSSYLLMKTSWVPRHGAPCQKACSPYPVVWAEREGTSVFLTVWNPDLLYDIFLLLLGVY